MSTMDTTEGRQGQYDKYRAILDDLVAMRDAHFARDPECGGEPMCPGAAVVADITIAEAMHPNFASVTLLVAIHELSRIKNEASAAVERARDAEAEVETLRSELAALPTW